MNKLQTYHYWLNLPEEIPTKEEYDRWIEFEKANFDDPTLLSDDQLDARTQQVKFIDRSSPEAIASGISALRSEWSS
jgi:hypothetical protein